jgi:hypothetical protein
MNYFHRTSWLSVAFVLVVMLASLPAAMAAEKGPSVLQMSTAVNYVKQFEFAASTAHGKPFEPGYQGKEAMKRVGTLYKKYPNNAKVKDLFDRVRTCLKKSRGSSFEITEEMLTYRKMEQLVAEAIGKEADKAWDAYAAKLKASPRYLPKPLPAPEPGGRKNEEGMFFRRVILKGFEYPANEFTTSGKQYTFVGGATQGFYFVELSNRRWLGAYEALRRYRREANGKLPGKWTVVGTVVGSDILVPRTGEKGAADIARFGWIVRPDAIYIPGLLFAQSDASHPRGGAYTGEEQLAKLKSPLLTYKTVPKDASAIKLVEVYAAAVKEKNYALYLDCLDPALQKSPLALENLRFMWRVNQESFAENFVHVEAFKEGKPQVIEGEKFDSDSPEAMFLDEEDRKAILARADDLVELIHVTIRRFDEKGKQVGSPRDLILRRYKGGRWYVREGLAL